MKVAAVIPAFNEEKTVGSVVAVVKVADLVNDVVVVSDGSTDRTAAAAREAGARVIELARNLGKGGAMQAGVKATDAGAILFLDADLVGLTAGHIRALLEPVLDGEADMVVGVFGKGRVATDLAQKISPWLSGQRAVRRDLLESLDLDIAHFGVEVALTRHMSRSGARVRTVTLEGLTHLMKEEKMGFGRGFLARLKMYWDIVSQVRSR
ncbi:MAG: glycosyltransferase [Firmicutes bacterium]|nr:glycosyltransferase [Bacillota bacterium]